MDDTLVDARQHFIEGLSRISQFWGFPRAMGAIYAALYLSPRPLSLDELTVQVNVTKGAVSTNVRALERLGMVHRQIRIGERKDYYVAEIDFWKIIRGILKEREKGEFDRAIHMVGESLNMTRSSAADPANPELAAFYQERMKSMEDFFHTLDNLVATILALDELRLGAVQRLIGGLKNHPEP
ncbi:MAG: GbsR/MarR family transcriptional regulator [Omnitrophica WOR_2 bacterium]